MVVRSKEESFWIGNVLCNQFKVQLSVRKNFCIRASCKGPDRSPTGGMDAKQVIKDNRGGFNMAPLVTLTTNGAWSLPKLKFL